MVEGILDLFPEAHVVDRRPSPSHGYRAVHLIVAIDRRLIEIQVRTEFQDLWAQLLERMADAYGRQIRYGGVPSDPEGAALMRAMLDIADNIAVVEEGEGEIARMLSQIEEQLESLPPERAQQARTFADAAAGLARRREAAVEALRALVVRDSRE